MPRAGRYRLLVCVIVVIVGLSAITLLRYRSDRSPLSALIRVQQSESLDIWANSNTTHDNALTEAVPKHQGQLTWTSLQDGTDENTAFFSAHYESRKGAPYTPGIIVMGYHMKKLKDPKLYCKLLYSSKASKCSSEPLDQINLCTGGLDADKIATSHMYVCRLKCRRSECSEDEIPVSVAISRNTDCTDASAQIPVINRRLPKESEKKMFGVCVQTPVYGSVSLQEIVEFIEMNRALGVEIVTLYVMEMEIETWQFLEDHYVKRGYLRLLRWKKMEKWNPLHYFGQPLLMQDCLYRNMHRVKYLLLIDLDELLLPKKHNNLLDLVNSIGHHDSYHSYVFGSCFFMKNEAEEQPSHTSCKKVSVPKYFDYTNRISCYCYEGSTYRQKFMIQTELVLDLFVHWVCWSMRGKEYKLRHSVGINAHYRNTLPGDCTDKSRTRDATALQYQSVVIQSMQDHVCNS